MIQTQVYVFMWSVIVGVILALIFDCFRLMRRKGKTNNIIVYIQDIVFWLIAMIIIVASAFITNEGELRGYMFIGYILGALFYLGLFSKFILKHIGIVLDFIEKSLEYPKRLYNKIYSKIKIKKKNVNF